MKFNFSSLRQFYPKAIDLSAKSSFKMSTLTQTISQSKKQLPPFDSTLKFGVNNGAHMLTIEWVRSQGWKNPQIKPFQNLSLHPFNSSLHYSNECFEGMKAYKSKGKLLLFRPQLNMFRLKKSAQYISLPDFDGNQLLACIQRLVKIDQRYVPEKEGFSLYIRPTFISNENMLGVRPPDKALLFVVTCPVGPYFANGFSPASLYCQTKSIRCYPNGSGEYKIGGNYGPTMRLQLSAAKMGCDQILWTFGGNICQVGASNIFFVEGEGNKAKLITPPLNTMILPGVTRQSIIQLALEMKIPVEERQIDITEVTESGKSGKFTECFVAGTAVIINSVKSIVSGETGSESSVVFKNYESSPVAKRLFETLVAIQYGRKPHPFSRQIK